MGIRKNRWIIWATLLILAVGALVTGAFVNHYFHAKAASYEAMNQQKHEKSGQNQAAANALNQTVKDANAEKKLMHQKQQQAEKANQQNADKENTNVVEEKSAANDTTSASPDNQASEPQGQSTQRNEQPQQENNSKRTVYLTFDDGPAPFSKDIIALLEQHHFKATFFMIDGNIRRYPDSARLMVQTGEGVGLHSVSHDKNKFYASVNSVLGELSQNQATLKEITGVESFLIRTPYGSHPYMTDEYKQAVYAHGYQMWDWNIDSRDWFYKDERYVNSVIEQINQKANYNGPLVILMHERKETLASLPKLLDYLSQQNFDCKAINSSIPPVHF